MIWDIYSTDAVKVRAAWLNKKIITRGILLKIEISYIDILILETIIIYGILKKGIFSSGFPESIDIIQWKNQKKGILYSGIIGRPVKHVSFDSFCIEFALQRQHMRSSGVSGLLVKGDSAVKERVHCIYDTRQNESIIA